MQMIVPPPASVESYASATENPTYVIGGTIQYVKIGRLVLWEAANLRLAPYDASVQSGSVSPAFFTGMPPSAGSTGMMLFPRSGTTSDGYIRMQLYPSGEIHPHYTKIDTLEHAGAGWYIAAE